MGRTLDALNAGSLEYRLVVAIEGYGKLLTNGSPAAAAAAYAGTDWTEALGSLFCEPEQSQSIHPWEALTTGGSCLFRVLEDEFGVVTHRKGGGASTELTQQLDRNDTTVHVLSTSEFPESGLVFIGTECIAYTGKTASTFTDCTRGMFSPLAAGGAGATRFAQHHRVGLDAQTVNLQPVVSELPRVWIGKWVTVHAHRVVGDVMDTLAEAHCVYAGKIVAINEEPGALATVVELKHALDVVLETSLGRQIWSANVKEGIFLKAPLRFELREDVLISGSVGQNDADDLVVVAGAASGAYQMPEGYYTNEELLARLESWLSKALVDGDILGSYAIYVDTSGGDVARTVIRWSISGVDTGAFRLTCPSMVARFMGFVFSTTAAETHIDTSQKPGGTTQYKTSETAPLRSLVDKFGNTNNSGLNFEVTQQRGIWINQLPSLPPAFNLINPDPDGLEWGLFLFDDQILILGARVVTGATIELQRCKLSPVHYGAPFVGDLREYTVPWEDGEREVSVRQIVIEQAPLAAVLKLLFYSTGTSGGYNSPTFDAFPFGLGLALPGALLGPRFEMSVDALPGATDSMLLLIDKTTTLADLLGGDLILRRAFLRWRQGGLQFGSWRTPTLADAVAVLDESNKAAPPNQKEDHRAAATQTSEWQYPIVKVQYDRDYNDLSTEGYHSTATLEDKTAVDDAGGEGKVLTLRARNTFTADGGATAKALIARFLAAWSMFSRTVYKLTRSISPELFDAIAVGDVVALTDAYARDPGTGRRGIVAPRAAMVVRVNATRGGAVPNSDTPNGIGGDVDVIFTEHNPDLAAAAYAPTADVDDTHDAGDFDGGYNSTEKKLRCYGYRYSDDGTLIAPLFTDAEWFPAGSRIRIYERDPADPSAPQFWDRVVVSQSADDVVLDEDLDGWDSAKFYRIGFDTFDDVLAAQRTKVFQADDADGQVLDLSPPYQYSSSYGASQFAPDMNATIGIELPPDQVYADGAGRDVGTEQALARLLDRFIDRQSGISLPVISSRILTNTHEGGTWMLVAYTPIYLSWELLGDVWREMGTSPWFRSAAGSVVQLRASLCRSKPSGFTVLDVDRGAVLSAATWTTDSTNWNDGTRIELDARVKSFSGEAWLLVECTLGCETRGLNRVIEGPRLSATEWWVP